MIDVTFQGGFSGVRKPLVWFLRARAEWHEIPNGRQIARHACVNLRHDLVVLLGRQGPNTQPCRPQCLRRASRDGLVHRNAARVATGAVTLCENLLQSGEKAGVGRVVHRGCVSGRGVHSYVGPKP